MIAAPMRQTSKLDAVQATYRSLVPLAIKGLRAMVLPDRAGFCHRAERDGQTGLRLIGRSDRYAAMTVVGLSAWEEVHGPVGIDTTGVLDHLVDWASGEAHLGDAALVLWGLCIRGDNRAAALAGRMAGRVGELLQNDCPLGSMPTGWLLAGAATAMRCGLGGSGLQELVTQARQRLLRYQCLETGLFRLGGTASWKRLTRRRLFDRLGSFASQVYPILGLSLLCRATGDQQALQSANACAERICRLQGADGQWWWIYGVREGSVVLRYPVYSIHQDAMGPMGLLALGAAGGEHHDDAILSGLAWLQSRPERPSTDLVDESRHVIWRAVQRDRPSATGAFGLGGRERLRMDAGAWLGGSDRRVLADGHVCMECRPYHLGWLLLAAAMAADFGAPRR